LVSISPVVSEAIGMEPLGSSEFGPVLGKIRDAKPNFIFSTVVGASDIAFHKQFKQSCRAGCTLRPPARRRSPAARFWRSYSTPLARRNLSRQRKPDAKPNFIFSTVVGASDIAFHKQFKQEGFKVDSMPFLPYLLLRKFSTNFWLVGLSSDWK
jgi:hypothetical protein